MKRYEPLVPIGLFTKADGSWVKIEDLHDVLSRLAGSRATFPLESSEDQAFMEGYRQALDHVREELSKVE